MVPTKTGHAFFLLLLLDVSLSPSLSLSLWCGRQNRPLGYRVSCTTVAVIVVVGQGLNNFGDGRKLLASDLAELVLYSLYMKGLRRRQVSWSQQGVYTYIYNWLIISTLLSSDWWWQWSKIRTKVRIVGESFCPGDVHLTLNLTLNLHLALIKSIWMNTIAI